MITFDDIEIRPFRSTDAEQFAQAVRESNHLMHPWMPWSRVEYTVDDALAWFASCDSSRSADSEHQFGIFSTTSGEFLGGVGLNQFNRAHRFCNLGYWVRQSKQKQGIATRAVRAITQYSFREHQLNRIEIVVAIGNVASDATALRAGAVHERMARNRLVLGDAVMDANIYAIVPGGN